MTDGWLRAARIVSRTTSSSRERWPGRLEQLVAVVDRRLAPDEDALLVEAVQQARVEQVVRARDVDAERLELVDGVVDVGVGHRRPAAGDVLLDRGAAQVEHAIVEAQHPVADVDGAQADAAPVDLHGLPSASAWSTVAGVELGVLRRPQLRVALDGDREAHAHALAGTQRARRRAALGDRRRRAPAAGRRRRAPARSSLWFCSQPSASTLQAQVSLTQTRCGSRPASCMTTPPRATSETWRVIPPQFHQPSRSALLRR